MGNMISNCCSNSLFLALKIISVANNQRQVRVARREYVIIGDDVKTKFTEDKS